MAYEVPEPGNAYLTYKVEDAPNTSYKAYLNAHGKSYTWLRRNRLTNEPEYKRWRERVLQDYDTYLKMYDSNFNASASQRARLEESGFSGQYLANGIGSSTSTAPSVNPGLYDREDEPRVSKGLNKVMQSLELMSAAGIAMKNYGEGKAAMKYATSIASGKSSLYSNQGAYWSTKHDIAVEDYQMKRLANSTFEDLGIEYNKETGLYFLNNKGNQTPWLQKYIATLNTEQYRNFLYAQQYNLNQLTYQNRKEYEAATMKAQKEILEGKKDLQDIEKDYATTLKRMGIAMPFLKAAMESLKLFL